MKLAEDLLPYLKEEQDWLEHELVKKAKQFLQLSSTPEMLAETLQKIQEQIEIELKSESPDAYVVIKLQQLINKHKKAAS